MTVFDRALRDKVRAIRTSEEAVARDARHDRVRMVRAGNLQMIAPDAFSENWPSSIIANGIDVFARDMAESLAPLPALNCTSGSMNSTTAKNRSDLRSKIGHYYWEKSDLKRQAVTGADWFYTFGFVPLVIEPDAAALCPHIRFEDPYRAYPELDRYGEVQCYVKVWMTSALRLSKMFPEYASRLMKPDPYGKTEDRQVELVRYIERDYTVMYASTENDSMCLVEVGHEGLSRAPVVVAHRSTIDGHFRGQFDDSIWVQVARNKMASLALEAGMKAVEAPIAVPQDMVDLPIGPDSIWRTDSPEKIRRVSMEISPSVFAMDQRLEMEQMRASRYPEARGGNIEASVITCRGVDALMGSFDSLIRTSQDQFGEALAQATSIAFEMDEKFYGDVSKEIAGVSSGAPYKLTYKASKAIAGDYTCDVTYGFMAGMAPNNAAVFVLQMLGAGLISKEMAQKQLPFDIDTGEMNTAITLERGRDALLEGMAQYASSIPAQAANGMDPMQAVQQIAVFLAAVKKGKSAEDAAIEAFTPPEPTEEELAAQEALAAQAGAPPGAAGPGGAPMGPQGPQALPDISQLVASFRGGRAEMSSSVRRQSLV